MPVITYKYDMIKEHYGAEKQAGSDMYNIFTRNSLTIYELSGLLELLQWYKKVELNEELEEITVTTKRDTKFKATYRDTTEIEWSIVKEESKDPTTADYEDMARAAARSATKNTELEIAGGSVDLQMAMYIAMKQELDEMWKTQPNGFAPKIKVSKELQELIDASESLKTKPSMK